MEKHISEMYLRNESQNSTLTTAGASKRNVPTFCVTSRKLIYCLFFGLVVLLIGFLILLVLFMNLSKEHGEILKKLKEPKRQASSSHANVGSTLKTGSNFSTGDRPSSFVNGRINKTSIQDLSRNSKPSTPVKKVTKKMAKSPQVKTTVTAVYSLRTQSNINEKCSCRGPRGPPGPIGLPGAKGSQGRRKGKKGEKGDTGPRGYDGTKGQKGEQGHRGSIGLPGERGPKGPSGKFGPKGPPGPEGAKGNSGSPGIKGEKGDKGDGVITVREKPKPYAHITGNVNRQKSSRIPLGIIRNEWRDFGLFAMAENGFTFRNGELIVPEKGTYNVYSQLYFRHNDKNIDPVMAHFVYKISGSDGEIILTGLMTRSVQLGKNPPLYTGYTAGQFLLKKGDRLMVGVPQELRKMALFIESFSYFGAYMIERT